MELAYKKTYDASFQGEFWRGTVEWYGLPSPLDFIWLTEGVVAATVMSKGGTMLEVRVFREPAYNLFGFPVLYHYVMEYDHHIVIPAVAWAIIELIVVLMIAIVIYFALNKVELLFRGTPDKYQPAESGKCRNGYVWDQGSGYCLLVSTPPDWNTIAYAAISVAGAIAVVEVVRLLRRR